MREGERERESRTGMASGERDKTPRGSTSRGGSVSVRAHWRGVRRTERLGPVAQGLGQGLGSGVKGEKARRRRRRRHGYLGRVVAPAVRDEVGQRRKPPRARLPLRRRPLGQDARRDADLERVRPRDGLTVLFASMRALVHLFHLYMR